MSDEASQGKEDRLRAEVAALRERLAGHERAARDSADRLELVEAELRQCQEEVARLQRDLREARGTHAGAGRCFPRRRGHHGRPGPGDGLELRRPRSCSAGPRWKSSGAGSPPF